MENGGWVGLWEEMAEKKPVDATPPQPGTAIRRWRQRRNQRRLKPLPSVSSTAAAHRSDLGSLCFRGVSIPWFRSTSTHESLLLPSRSPRANAKHVREHGSRTSERERRQEWTWSGPVRQSNHTTPCPGPSHGTFSSSLLVAGAEPIGRISRTSIPRDLSRTQRIILGLEARRCSPWHRTTTTETTKDPYQCHPPPLPPRASHSIAKGKVAVVPDSKFTTPPRSRRRYSRRWNVAST